MRLAAFILALLLLAGTIDPTQGWLIALVVVTGLAMFRWRWYYGHPVVDIGLASFVIAVLLLAGTVEPDEGLAHRPEHRDGAGDGAAAGHAHRPVRVQRPSVAARAALVAGSAAPGSLDDAWSADDDGWRRWERRMDERREHVRDYGPMMNLAPEHAITSDTQLLRRTCR